MLPIGDVNPTRRLAIINYLLIAANILAFVYELSLGEQRLDAFIAQWGVRSTEVIALINGQLGLLTTVLLKTLVSMFLHGGWLHIGGNMLFLWIFGDNIEDNFGSLEYLVFYLICGFGAALAQAFLTPESPLPAIGASGAISGVLAAYLLLYPGASIRALLFIFIFFTMIRVPAWLMIIFWFGTQLANGLASITDASYMNGGVAYGAHVGGFVAGFILAFFFRKPARTHFTEYERYSRR
ncbi:MAG TPA: rhomboid family intramembrane serine protease [Roseiflexaceae bacterium]|nr:rhomboid family intramembrane serine protease [Roseiflexaceae bacterium]